MNMVPIRSVVAAMTAVAVLSADAAAQSPVAIQVVYDNYAADPGFPPDWGFACVVTCAGKTLLFDAGGKGELLLANLGRMNARPADIPLVVISHNHGDHTGGLPSFLKENRGASVFLPAETPEDRARNVRAAAHETTVVDQPIRLCDGAFVLGPMRDRATVEQALVLDTPAGLVIVTGCAHPGVVAIAKRAKEEYHRDIHMILGGLHLLKHTDDQVREVIGALKQLGVRKIAPSHCTGDKAVAMFKAAFGDDFTTIGAGRSLRVGGD